MKTTLSNSLMKLSAIGATLLLCACGDSTSQTVPLNATSTTLTSGQIVDNYVAELNYRCADGMQGITDVNGQFNCTTLPVTFSIGGLKLGEISTIPADSQVFPQDLLGLERTDINNTTVMAMAQFLQSCDDDKNPNNGIKIKTEVTTAFEDLNLTFSAEDLDYYATEANLTLIPQDDALNHLHKSVTFVEDVDNTNIPTTLKSALFTPQYTLTQTTKETLSFMGNEERLAHDVYLELYNYHISHGNGEIQQLTNIATKSETTHIQTVQALINKYDLDYTSFTNIDMPELAYKDTNIDDMVMGRYDIQEIQDLHDMLLAKGEQSVQDALEVGCMVEVTDIEDLLRDIQAAKDSNASDVVSAFEFLRDGSYSHYWSFDSGLKTLGIDTGCCSLGDTYCHPEFPQDTQGADASSGSCDNENQQTGTASTTAPRDGTGAQKGKR